MIYQKQRDYRRACKELKEAVKLDPNNVQVREQARGGRGGRACTGRGGGRGWRWGEGPDCSVGRTIKGGGGGADSTQPS